MSRQKKRLALLLAGALLLSCALCWLCYRFDNKYTRPRPTARQGVTLLNLDWYDSHPFFYLADGWSFYRDALLTPEEAAGRAPDAFFYLGRYGGFDLGDPAADPHGRGTYRAVIETDGRLREFALELTPIFSRWRLWVNGELRQSVGYPGEGLPDPPGSLITFRARDQVELVVAVEDDRGFYSGMVYPPAFGSPRLVDRMVSARLLLHGAACAVALILCLTCLSTGLALHRWQPYRALSALCLCFCGSTAWPAVQALGLWGGGWPPFQRLCYYGVFLSLFWVLGQVLELPRLYRLPACAAGALVCAAVLLQPLLPAKSAGELMALSSLLSGYKWFTALWLFFSGLWALRRGRRGSAPLLAGGCAFACALVMDSLLPLYEPILTGWFPELAGGALMLLTGGVAFSDTLLMQREKRAAQVELEVRAKHALLQQEYVRQTRERLHESRHRLTLISHYLRAGELDRLGRYLEEISAPTGGIGSCEYTGHPLVDAILTVQLSRAPREGVYVEQELEPLPAVLPLPDGELTILMMNLLDNAFEANARITDPGARWISLRLAAPQGGLSLTLSNAAPPDAGEETSKPDKQAHGFGLKLVRELVARHAGSFSILRGEESFCVSVEILGSEAPDDAAAPAPRPGQPKLVR